jgi:hypothetical protein
MFLYEISSFTLPQTGGRSAESMSLIAVSPAYGIFYRYTATCFDQLRGHIKAI